MMHISTMKGVFSYLNLFSLNKYVSSFLIPSRASVKRKTKNQGCGYFVLSLVAFGVQRTKFSSQFVRQFVLFQFCSNVIYLCSAEFVL